MKIAVSLILAALIYAVAQQERYLFDWYNIDKSESMHKVAAYEKLRIPLGNNINFMHYYAQNLLDENEIQKADSLLSLIAKRNPNNSFFMIWGDTKLVLKDTAAAIDKFWTASGMVPNTIEPKFKLFAIYLEQKDSLNARFWASKIARQKIKIATFYTDLWQEKAKDFL